jgi:hypothetical protein
MTTTYKAVTHYIPIDDGIPQSLPVMSYKGFPIRRLDEHVLFEIVPRDGTYLPAMLAGRFSKLPLLYDQIDKYLEKYPIVTADTLDEAPKQKTREMEQISHLRRKRKNWYQWTR